MLHYVNICKTVMSIASIELALVLYVSVLHKKGNFRMKVPLMRVRITIIVMEKQ